MSNAGAAQTGPNNITLHVTNRHKVMMLAATAGRMGVGLLTFIILARFLGPENFGVIATALAYATFFCVVTDYGLAISALRNASAQPAEAATVVSDALSTKLVLTFVATIIGAALLIAIVPASRLGIFALIFFGASAYSYGDLAMVALRAHRRFGVEAAIVLGTSVLMLIISGGIAAATRSLEWSALAFAVSRALYLVITLMVLRREKLTIFLRLAPEHIKRTLIGSSGFALDSILTALSSQVDMLLFGAMLTAHDIGIYQAGARLCQAIIPVAVVLSTVYMPALSAAAINGDNAGFRRASSRLALEFTVLAVVSGMAFAFLGPLVTHLLYGTRYDALIPLWPGFGAFVMLRFASAAYGIQLAALGKVKIRVINNVASMGLFLALSPEILHRFGLKATSNLVAFSATMNILILGLAMLKSNQINKGLQISCQIATLCASLMLFSEYL